MPLLLAVSTYLACFLGLILFCRFRFCCLVRETQLRAWKEANMARERRAFLRANRR